jgi:hypothetical protein
MLRSYEIESMRRSHAMAPLSPLHVNELIETCVQFAREREQIACIVLGLPESFAELRTALNELHRMLR